VGNTNVAGTTTTLTNCTVSGNSAVTGGGISNQGTLVVDSSTITMQSCTVISSLSDSRRGIGSGAWRVSVARASGRSAGGRFRRCRPPEHGSQGRLAQRLAQHSVGPDGIHDRGRVVLLPRQ
jgi:hypothetical protein